MANGQRDDRPHGQGRGRHRRRQGHRAGDRRGARGRGRRRRRRLGAAASAARRRCVAVEARGRRGKAYSIDLRHVDQIRRIVPSVIADFGELDILVNNAGRPAARARGGDLGGRFRRDDRREPEGAVLLRSGGGALLDRQGARRQDRQHHVDLGRCRLPDVLGVLREQGRSPARRRGRSPPSGRSTASTSTPSGRR